MSPDLAPAARERRGLDSPLLIAVTRLLPWVILLVALVTLASMRTVENLGEYDRYPDTADSILRGEISVDRFHGFGYPVAIAATTATLGISSYHAGLLLALIAALLMVWGTTTIADNILPGTGRTAVWLLAANAVVWTMGTTVAADMPAAGLLVAGGALVSVNAPLRSAWRILGIGILLGAAVSAHPSLLLVALPVAAVAAWRCQRRSSWPLLLLALLAGYLPHLVPCLVTGRSILGDGWQNSYLKVVCNWDTEMLQHAYHTNSMPSLWTFLCEHKGAIWSRGASDILAAATKVLPAMMVGSTVPIAGIFWWLPALALVSMLVTPGRRRLGALLSALLLLHVGIVCFAFQPITRILLPSFAILLVGLAIGIETVRRRWRAGHLLFWVVLAGVVAIGQLEVRRFWASEPVHEVEVVKALPGQMKRPISVLSTYALLDRYVDYPCWRILRRDPSAYGSHERAWSTLRESMQRSGASILVVGRLTGAAAFAAIANRPPPADFKILREDADVFVAEFDWSTSDWIEALDLPAGPARRGHACELALRLSDTADAAQVASVGVALRNPAGEQQLLDLVLQERGRYQRVFLPDVAGTWLLDPVVLCRDGKVLRGASVELVVVE
jgi:hypothetical protein